MPDIGKEGVDVDPVAAGKGEIGGGNQGADAGRVEVAQLAAKAGLPLNMDSWDGYPAARDRLLAAAQRADANLVTRSGDSHNAWAFDLTRDVVEMIRDRGIASLNADTMPTMT